MPWRDANGKPLSGSQQRKRRKAESAVEVKREVSRDDLNAELDALLVKIGDAPMDPVGNSEWANNLAAAMAAVLAKDRTLPLPDRCKRVAEMIDRIGYTQPKAAVAKRIREVKQSVGVEPEELNRAE